ncbi:unnamed protein product, partial [Polarella glacialis]
SELLNLYKKWDCVGALHITLASKSIPSKRCGLFGLRKSDTHDRQIINPIPENSRLFATDASPWAAGIVSTGLSSALLNEMLSIPRPLSEGVLWDVCEVFKGEGHFSKMREERGLRVHPGFEILIDPELGDIMLDSTAWAIMGLILRRVVLVWLFAPPCITFGTLIRPRLRSKEQPGGFDPNCPITRRGNRFAFRAAIFMNLIGFCNQYAYAEQPRGSVMYKLWIFLQLLQHPASRFDIYNFPVCGHGSPFEKFSSWMSNVPGMEVMRDVCRCPFKGKHLRVESSFTQEALDLFCQRCDPSPLEVYGRTPARGESLARFSGSYPLAAMRKIAAISEAALAGLTVDDDRRPAFVPPKWIVELAAGLDYRVDVKYQVTRGTNHININEQLAFGTLVKHLANRHPDSRAVTLQDSRVVLGANAKGRSSSNAMNFHMSHVLPYQIGGNVYVSALQVPSAFNPSDDTTRDKPLRRASLPRPFWLDSLERGDYAEFGYPGEGPRPAKNTSARASFDLTPVARLAPKTAGSRLALFSAFERWCAAELDAPVAVLARSGLVLSTALIAYGRHLFYSEKPLYIFTETLNGIVDRYRHLKVYFAECWSLISRWEDAEPTERKMVLPEPVIRAIVALSLSWGWPRFAAAILLGFHGLLRIKELLSLTRADLILPADLLAESQVAYCRVRDPKTKHIMRRQHVRISDILSVQFLHSLFSSTHPDELLVGLSPAQFRRRWSVLLSHLSIPVLSSDSGATPGCLRGSGATWFYQATEDVPRLAWRGRWTRVQTLEHYLQEVAGQVLLASLTLQARETISQLAVLAQPALESFISPSRNDTCKFAASSMAGHVDIASLTMPDQEPDPAPAPVQEPAQDPETAPDPEPDPAPAPEPAPAQEPAQDTEPAPAQDPAPDQVFDERSLRCPGYEVVVG